MQLSRWAVLVTCGAWGLCPCPAQAWGATAQRLVLLEAIESLPKGPKEFYKTHRLELPTLAPEGQPPEDTAERRFAIDRLVPFPFRDVPLAEEPFKARFGEEGTRIGRLPWLVQESYQRLVEAMKSGDGTRILAESDLLAFLVAQMNNPLALTDNADGQKTDQHGLWTRFTVRLPEAMGGRLKLQAEAARYLDDPRRYVGEMAVGGYVYADNVLFEEALAKRGQAGFTELYYEAFERRAGKLLRERLSAAATDVGSYWYTAWTVAGRPALK